MHTEKKKGMIVSKEVNRGGMGSVKSVILMGDVPVSSCLLQLNKHLVKMSPGT